VHTGIRKTSTKIYALSGKLKEWQRQQPLDLGPEKQMMSISKRPEEKLG
jgi:hypothetical protein